jgi:hypothetical protein
MSRKQTIRENKTLAGFMAGIAKIASLLMCETLCSFLSIIE